MTLMAELWYAGEVEALQKSLLLKLNAFKRRRFFQLWNQIQDSEYAYVEVPEKLERIISALHAELSECPQPPKIPQFIRFISMLDEEYPQALLELPQPPLGLYVWGDLGSQARAAVVGSRKPVPYALRLTRDLVRRWVAEGYSIMSGGALGVDAEAHRICLESGGHTLVVLGGGLLCLYPKVHEKLFREVVQRGGALISEYPPDMRAQPYTFPERNRIIAALCDVLFLAQAHAQSGSLSTARTALDLGREIHVLRPIPGDENFAGSQKLIDDGARILIDAHELERPFLELES